MRDFFSVRIWCRHYRTFDINFSVCRLFYFSHDAQEKAAGSGLVLSTQTTRTIVTAYQPCQAFSRLRHLGHTCQNATNAA